MIKKTSFVLVKFKLRKLNFLENVISCINEAWGQNFLCLIFDKINYFSYKIRFLPFCFEILLGYFFMIFVWQFVINFKEILFPKFTNLIYETCVQVYETIFLTSFYFLNRINFFIFTFQLNEQKSVKKNV